MKRSHLIFLLKALVSLGMLSFLFSRIDMGQLLRALSLARPSYLIPILLAYFLGQLISSVRWALLARPLGFRNSLRDFATFYFIGMFFNLFAPSTVGGDVGRVFYLARGETKVDGQYWTSHTTYALISVIADRTIGMAVLVWIGAMALVLFPTYSIPWVVRYSTFALALVLILAWAVLPLLNRFLKRRGDSLGKNLAGSLETFWRNQQIILQTFLLSLVVHLIQAWIQLLLGRALDLEIPWSYCLILYPLVGIFSALPISLNGIGLREGGYLFLLQLIDVSSEKAVAFGLLWFIIVVLESLIGGVVFIARKSRPVSSEAVRL